MNHKELKMTRVAVTSRSFSKNSILRDKLLSDYPLAKFNDSGEELENDSLIHFLSGYEKVIAGIERYDADIFSSLPNLKVLSRFGVGVDQLDMTAMNQQGIYLGWSPGVNTISVAELTLGFMLSLIRNSFFMSQTLKSGVWSKTRGHQLSEKTIGIIGFGHIGREIARLLTPFHCRILIHDVSDITIPTTEKNWLTTDFNRLIEESDIITLHVPATSNTINLIHAGTFSKMKPSAFLINTARGSLVDQDALKSALQHKQIAGAAIDVYQTEPPTDAEFLNLPNLICTPHIGGNSVEAELVMGRAAIQGLESTKLPKEIFTSCNGITCI